MTGPTDCDAVQSLVFSGHSRLPFSIAAMLRVSDAAAARVALGRLADEQVLYGIPAKSRSAAVHVLLSGSGLRALGTTVENTSLRSREFGQGMTAAHRSHALGDTGNSDPKHWIWSDSTVHAVILLYGETSTQTDQLAEQSVASISPGWTPMKMQPIRLTEREPFGFRDGLSNPRIDVKNEPCADPDTDRIPLTEVVMGHGIGAAHRGGDVGRNGTYVVIRQLAQDVERFWRFWREAADDDEHAVWLASKAVGRWPNGMPVTGASPCPPPGFCGRVAKEKISFAADPFGDDCPLGAHIRRANPRDGLTIDAEESRTISGLHRLLRRGRVYGPPPEPNWFPPGVLADLADSHSPVSDPSRGLFFMALCSDISRQFEFVQQTWLNNPKHVAPYNEVDPITVGARASGDAGSFTIPKLPLRHRITGIEGFVTVVGGGYFLMPGREGFRLLCGQSVG